MVTLTHTAIFLLFVVAAYVQLLHEKVIYQQKDNKKGYDSLEHKRKTYRNCLYAIFFALGILSMLIGLRSIPTLFAGVAAYWILFDGWYATKVMHEGWWFMGHTFTKNQAIRTEKKSKLIKLIIAAVAVAGVIINILYAY